MVRLKYITLDKQKLITINEKNSHINFCIPSATDSSEGPVPTASEVSSFSGSLSCSDLTK